MRCLNHLAFRHTPQIATLATFGLRVSTTPLIGKLGKPVSAQRMHRLRESAFGWLRGCATCRLHPPSGLKFQLWKVQFTNCFGTLQSSYSALAARAPSSPQFQDLVRQVVPETCPVTKPPAKPFVPPSPYWRDHRPNQFWYGSESLWTLLGVAGT